MDHLEEDWMMYKVLNIRGEGGDMVSVDAGCPFFGINPLEIGHIRIAHKIGIGRADIEKLKIMRMGVKV